MPREINNKSVYTPGGLTGVLNKNSALAPAKTNGVCLSGVCAAAEKQSSPQVITLQLAARSHIARPSPTTRKVTPFQEDSIALGRLSPNAAVLGRPCGTRVLLIAGILFSYFPTYDNTMALNISTGGRS